jgi:RnfABCDGE-type electron transport complex B subunit
LQSALDALAADQCALRVSGCRPYARRSSPGAPRQPVPAGERHARALAAFLGREFAPLDPRYGVESPPRVAVIDEQRCIGCAKCIPACPVDAIVGAHRFMHTVLSSDCTGCELCLPPCPVDCIDMRPLIDVRGNPLPIADFAQLQSRVPSHRRRYEAHLRRREREARSGKFCSRKKRQATVRHKRMAPVHDPVGVPGNLFAAAGGGSDPHTELKHASPFSCWCLSFCQRKPPTKRQSGDRAPVSRRPHARRDAGAGRLRAFGIHPFDRPLQHQGTPSHRDLPDPDRALQR